MAMMNMISQPPDTHSEPMGVATPPRYRVAAIHSAVPATKEEWEDLLRNNTSCLKGIIVSRQAGTPEMAQYTAFKFKYDPAQGPEHVQDEKTASEVIRIDNESQLQAVNIGISQYEIEVLMKTVATDLGLDFRTRQASLHLHNRSSKTKKLQISHKHAKFTLFLDERSLSITEACQARLMQLKDTDDRRRAVAFLEDYGEVFAMQATLGGQLFHTENISKLEGEDLEQKENSLKIAAKASLSSTTSSSKATLMGAEAEMLHKTDSKISRTTEGMFWVGVGGDPCLHGDPKAWMLSMKEDKSRWKIIEKKFLVTLPVALGKFDGFEWVPEKFSQLLRPLKPSLPPLVLSEGVHIGLSSFAITAITKIQDDDFEESDVGHETPEEKFFVVFQDQTGCIKYGYVDMSEGDQHSDVLFVDTIVRARHDTPLLLFGTGIFSPLSIVYVTEDGVLARQNLDASTGAWDYGSLVDLRLQVAPYSNLAATSTISGEYVCFQGLDGNICLVGPSENVICMDHGEDLNMLPGTALTMTNWENYTGSFPWRSFHHHLAIGFQSCDGRLMSLERREDENGHTQWNLSEIIAPSITEGIQFKPWSRANCLLVLLPGSPSTIEYAFFPDSSDRLICHARESSEEEEFGPLVRHSNPVCSVWGNSRYAYADGALVYVFSDGHLACTLPWVAKTRAVFQSHCRKRCHAQLRKTRFLHF